MAGMIQQVPAFPVNKVVGIRYSAIMGKGWGCVGECKGSRRIT